ncbi:MAG TPA: polysaccharide deacetylase family protein [Candidatus Saccharimonadales bacterium]|nr:polysaccharide deacetylase family protein [Candidatus Saccharimonadales bacterium]
MSKKKHMFRQKIAKALVSTFILALCLIPLYMSLSWAIEAVGGRDHRSATAIAAFHTRPIDRTGAPLQPLKQPIVSITFDDGWESVYTEALPILRENGFHTTQYIITDTFDRPNYLSIDQLKAMQKAGEEIAAHTITHSDLTTLDVKQIEHELKDAQSTLERNFGGSVRDFTSPFGAYNTYTLKTIAKYYRSQKNAEGDPVANPLEAINVASDFNALNIRSYSVRRSTTMADLNKLLDNARNNNGWLVLTYHQVDNSGADFSVTPDFFRKQIELLSKSNVRSATVGTVLDTLTVAKR